MPHYFIACSREANPLHECPRLVVVQLASPGGRPLKKVFYQECWDLPAVRDAFRNYTTRDIYRQ